MLDKELTKKKLLISFSGGKTSGYMLWWLMNRWQKKDEYDIVVVFANTGKESFETLLFVHQCSVNWNIPIIWVEALPVQSKRGKWWGVSHKIVDYFTASRGKKLINGEFEMTPFEEMIIKLGIPTTNAPFCSDQLKKKAINSYLKSIGWRSFYKAIGIRTDELDRINENYKKLRIFYPLAFLKPTTKIQVNGWWKRQAFILQVHEDSGNCDNCWKKDLPRLVRNAERIPESFDWWEFMTLKYGNIQNRKGTIKLKPPFNFYRGNISPSFIKSLVGFSKNKINEMAKQHRLNGCSESCEAY